MNFATRVAYLASTLATLIVTGSFTLSSMTLGSVLFAGTGGLVSQDNASFFFDDTNNRLGIGTTTPDFNLEVEGTSPVISSTGSNSPRVYLSKPGDTDWQIRSNALSTNEFSIAQDGSSPRITITSATGYVGIHTAAPASLFEVFQTPTNASGVLADTQRLLISGTTTSALARGLDWSYNGAFWAAITSNASSGKHLLYAAQPNNYWAIQSQITTSTSLPGLSVKNDTSYSASSGSQVGVKMEQTINQTGTAAFDSLLIDRTNTAVGSGNQNFLNLTTAGTFRFRIDTDGHVFMDATNTAGGTTGNQTINKPSGTVNFAAGNSTLTVTNSLVSTSSIVMAVLRSNGDATAYVKSVVPSAGSFIIELGGATATERSVGFVVFN
jgi:hypothetical protein